MFLTKSVSFRPYAVFVFVVFSIALIVSPALANTKDQKKITIYFTGNTWGYLRPCST